MSGLTLTYSVADQEFERTKSLGVLHVSLELARRLAERPEVARLHILGNRSVEGHVPASGRVAFTSHDEATRGRVGRVVWDQFGLYEAAKRAGNDVLFLPKGFAPFTQAPPVRLVTYVHDTMIHRYERNYPGGFPLLERRYFGACFRASLKYSSLILTNSDFTTAQVSAVAGYLGLDLPPVVTVGIGISSALRPTGPKHNRIVVPASRWPHKRTDLALAYLARWTRETDFSGAIDWVGSLPPGSVLPEVRNWRVHPRLPDPEYTRLVSDAKALVYFSEYEGFGMPPVEAAALGTCPVYSSIPATREVMAGAGYGFENQSYESFSAAMTAAMDTSADDVLAWGEQLLARHNWDAVMCRVTQALGELGGSASRAVPCGAAIGPAGSSPRVTPRETPGAPALSA